MVGWSLGQRAPKGDGSWGLVTTRLYLINGQQVLGEVSRGMQNRWALNG